MTTEVSTTCTLALCRLHRCRSHQGSQDLEGDLTLARVVLLKIEALRAGTGWGFLQQQLARKASMCCRFLGATTSPPPRTSREAQQPACADFLAGARRCQRLLHIFRTEFALVRKGRCDSGSRAQRACLPCAVFIDADRIRAPGSLRGTPHWPELGF